MKVLDWTIVIVAAAGGALAFRELSPRLHLGPRGTFEVRDAQWTRTESPPTATLGTHVSYDGTARVVGTGALAGARALVVVWVVRDKRVSALAPVDTVTEWATSFDGGGVVRGQDWAFACSAWDLRLREQGTTCDSVLAESAAHFEVVGWLRLASPVVVGRRE